MNKIFKTIDFSWEITLLLIILLLTNGAYSAMQFMPFALTISILLLISTIYKVITQSQPITLNWISIVCFAIGSTYILSLFTALSTEQTILKILEWWTYGALFLWLPKYQTVTIRNSLTLFSSFFVIIHFLLLFGLFDDKGILILANDLSISGIRLNGWLHYANATGAIAGALWLYNIQTVISIHKWRILQWTNVFALPFLLLVTESRGTILVVGLISFLILIFKSSRQQLAVPLLLSASTSFLMYLLLIFANNISIAISITVIIIIVLAFTIIKYEQLLSNKKDWKITGLLLFLTVGVVFILIAYYHSRLNFSTLGDRLIYIQDAWKATINSWLVGYGGEAWQFAMFEFQSAPYISNDVHMFYIQHFLETGLIGMLILCIAIVLSIYKITLHNRYLLIPISVILLHAMIDFTLSFSLSIVIFLIFILEALNKDNEIKCKNSITLSSTILFTLPLIIITYLWIQGENNYKDFLHSGKLTALHEAQKFNPYATRFNLAEIDDRTSVELQVKILERALQYEPHNARTHFLLAEAYELLEPAKAIHHFEKALQYDRFDRLKYERAIEALQRIQLPQAKQLQQKIVKQYNDLQQSKRAKIVQDQRDFFQ